MEKFRHSEQEIEWAKQQIGILEKATEKTVKEHGTGVEYERLFHRKMTYAALAQWLRVTFNPELKKRYYSNNKKTRDAGSVPKSERKELEVFNKSQFIAYAGRRICGFEDLQQLEAFLTENRILADDVKVFKMLPVKIEYKVQIGN